MINKCFLIGPVVAAVFTLSTVLAQNGSADQLSEVQTVAANNSQRGGTEAGKTKEDQSPRTDPAEFAPRSKVLKGIRGPVLLAGTSSTGGGGVRKIKTDSFPDKQKLAQAVEVITAKIAAAELPGEFKTTFLEELTYLYKNDQIRTVPALLVHVGGDQFNSFSGRSRNRPREAIVLSWFEHSQKSIEDSASNIVHEILHNISSEALVQDETYLEDLESAIISGNVSKEILQALKYGIYLGHGKIFQGQFFDLVFDVNHPTMRLVSGLALKLILGRETEENKHLYDKFTAEIARRVRQQMPLGEIQPGSYPDSIGSHVFNVAFKVIETRNKLAEEGAFTGLSRLAWSHLKDGEERVKNLYYENALKMIANMFLEKIIEFNPSAAVYKDVQERNWYYGCIKYKHEPWFSSKISTCEEYIRLSKYLIPETKERIQK